MARQVRGMQQQQQGGAGSETAWSQAATQQQALQRQQLLGLEALLLAGVCHRQSVEDLLASDAISPDGFEWVRQVRCC